MKYHKITTLWKRQDQKPYNMVVGQFALPELELLKDVEWVSTEKVDGTNVRVMWDGQKVTFGGKTDNAQIPVTLYDRLNELFGSEAAEQKFEEIFGESKACLYGEGYGNKIQKAGKLYNSEGVNFILFDISVDGWWLRRKDLEDISKRLDTKIVPIVFKGTLQETSDYVKEKNKSTLANLTAEGIVAKPAVELFSRKGERIITKLKHKDFEKL